MSAKKDALKFLLKRLANKTGATPEEIPMSISNPRLMEDLRRGLAPMIPGGPYQRGEASRLDIKFPIQPKTKTKTQKELSAEENRILQEKKLDKILENRLATIKRQQVESDDDVIDIETGKLLEDSDEVESTSTFISNINKFSPTTLTRSKAVDLKGPKAKELVKTMNRLEKSEIEQNKLLSSISKTKQNAVTESDFKQVEMLTKSLNKETNSKQNKLDRAALRKYFKEKKIAEGEPVKVRPTSKKKRDPDTGKVTVTKGTTSRDSAKGLDEESQLPNIVGQASDPKSPVIKLDVRANPGFPDKKEQEFFMDKVQDYLDQGDDLKTARKRAGNDLQEKKLSELTVDQLRDKMGRGSVDSPIEMDDIKPSRSIDYGQPRSDTEGLSTLVTDKLGDIRGAEYKVNKKKAGGQVGKPKRKIKKSVLGNDLVAMMYD
tara:strand:+ start:410 stop:1708 length:1299 start_codon:yes stop_codon:yes gene_type:complete